MHGWLILDKPMALGSTQAVAVVRRGLRQAGFGKVKVGHGGTLDPLASGVLPIAIGEATKLSGRMLDADKAYDFTIAFGAETDTLDLEGAVIAESGVRPTLAEVAAVLPRFTGAIRQTPPVYSALKVDGRRAYDLARAGEAVVLAERAVFIRKLAPRHSGPVPLLSPSAKDPLRHAGSVPGSTHPLTRGQEDRWAPEQVRSDGALQTITLSALVSKGTYVRSLARDIALALGTVGHVTMLRRTKAGPFTLAQAISLDKWEEAAKGGAVQAVLLPLTAGLDDIPVLAVSPEQAQALRQGKRLSGIAAPHGLTLAMLGTVPIALVDVADEIKVVRGLNLMSE